jgi:hypothetical protein
MNRSADERTNAHKTPLVSLFASDDVVVMVLCGFLGWSAYQLNWIRKRHSLGNVYFSYTPGKAPDAPWPLWLFGEQGYESVQIGAFSDEGFQLQSKDWDAAMEKSFQDRLLTIDDQKKLAELRRLFPEAT